MDTNKICRDFINALIDHEYDMYSDYAVRDIVETSLEKKAHLIEMFRKHPKWDEEQLCIHFDHDVERKLDSNAYTNFMNWLWQAGRKQLGMESDEKNPLLRIIHYWTPEESSWGGGTNLYDVLSSLPGDTLLPEFTEYDHWYQKNVGYLNEVDAKFNFRPGMKLNRVVNKVCVHFGLDKLGGYDRAFAQFSDEITPLKICRHTTISVNPVDFLLMSNGNSWQSCHYIGDDPDDAGCYSSGTVSYMMGEDSFIVSVIDKEWPEDNLAFAPKINRQVFGYNDHQLLQSRLYPQACDNGASDTYKNLREMVEQIIAEAEGEANRWVKAENMNVHTHGTAYKDWDCFSVCGQYNLRAYADDMKEPIRMCEKPICIECGNTHWNESNILCDGCLEKREVHYCEGCGRTIQPWREEEGEDYWEDGGDYYCSDCYFKCEKCGEIHRKRYEVWISDIEESWCEDCADWYAARCEKCGNYITKENAIFTEDEETFCESCFEDECAICAECGGAHRVEDMTLIDDEWYCTDCANELEESKEESA